MQPKRSLTQYAKRAKDGFVAFLRRRDPVEYFIALMLLGLTVFVLRCAIGGSDALIGIFFERCEYLFYDFFAPVRDASMGVGVYTEMDSIYPPLSNLVLSLFSLCLPAEFLALPREHFYLWYLYPTAVLSYLLFFTVTLLLPSVLLSSFDSFSLFKMLLCVVLAFAGAMIGRENGNSIGSARRRKNVMKRYAR
jgi:hypothetical protein